MTDILIIPILNKQSSLFSGSTLFLNDNCFIEKLTDIEHSAFFRDAPTSIKEILDIRTTKCIKLTKIDFTEDSIKNYKVKISFLLNLFHQNSPAIIIWAAHLSGDKRLNVKKIYSSNIPLITHLKNEHFKLNKEISRQAMIQFYQIIENAIKINKLVIFTLEKFVSALLRNDFVDKLLDTTICFETLTPGNQELVYRLSQNISFIVSENATERLEVFNDMKNLYDVRSKFVHGDISEKINDKMKNIQLNWHKYEKYLKSAVTYYLFFLMQNKKDDWENHLKELVLGTQNKIINTNN